MKIKKKRKIHVFAVLAAVVIVLSGCQNINRQIIFTTGLNRQELFKAENIICSKQEGSLLLVNTKNKYEEAFGEDIWQQEIEGISFETYIKNTVKNQIAQLKCMALYAEKENIVLSEEKKKAIEEAAAIYFNQLTETEKEVLEVNPEDVAKVYTDYAVADQLYQYLTQDVEEEISDAEAKVIVVQHIYKDTTDMTEQEKNEVYKTMEEIEEEVKQEGADFNYFAQEYSDDTKIEYIFGREEMDSSFEQAAFSLEKGEISDIIESSSGYHIIKCINDYDMERTNSNKKVILEKRKKEAFDQVYGEFAENLLTEFHDKVWNKMNISDYKEVKSSNLYQIYQEQVWD